MNCNNCIYKAQDHHQPNDEARIIGVVVADVFRKEMGWKIKPEDLSLRTRIREIRQPRQFAIAIYYARNMAAKPGTLSNRISLYAISTAFNLRSHATVLHSVAVVNNDIQLNPRLRFIYNTCISRINAAISENCFLNTNNTP